MKLCDKIMWQKVKQHPNAGVAWYLMSAYTYYAMDVCIISDGAFDELAKFLLKNWSKIKHQHKRFITKADLKAGTLLFNSEKLPNMVKSAAVARYQTLRR